MNNARFFSRMKFETNLFINRDTFLANEITAKMLDFADGKQVEKSVEISNMLDCNIYYVHTPYGTLFCYADDTNIN